MSDTTSSRPIEHNGHGVERTGILRERLQHVSWGAIFLGLVIAIAVQILLGLLGMGIGLTIIDPADPMGGLGSWGIGTMIYVVITQIIALFIGGYAAAKLAPSLTNQSAMFHGAAIWALSLILTVWLGISSIGLAVSGISNAVSGVASATTSAVKMIVPDDISLPDIDYQSLPEPLRQTLEENGITPENLTQEVRGAYRDVVSQQQQQRLISELQSAVQRILQNPTGAPEEIEQALDNMFGENGILSQQDLEEMQNTLQQRLNLSDQEVQNITDQLQQSVEQMRARIEQAITDAREAAAEAAETVTDQIGFIALWMFIASVLGLIAAVAGGRAGENKARVV